MDFLRLLMQVSRGRGGGGGAFIKQQCRTDKSCEEKRKHYRKKEEKARDVKKLVSEAANWSRLLLLKNAMNFSF